MDILTVHTSVETKAQADGLAQSVLHERLAACVQTAPINSAYWWQGKITHSDEIAMTFKTAADRVYALMVFIRENHPYEIAEITAYKCDKVDPGYADWVEKETR